MPGAYTFFSFTHLADSAGHRAYNEWHQLDHRPENLALPGVAWGDRWWRTDECAATGPTPATEFRGVDYVSMYWFRPPVTAAVEAWHDLGEVSFQWGRGPVIPGVQRRLTAFFKPVKGYAAERVRVSPQILPYRPNRGLHVQLTRVDEPHGQDTHERYEWEDRVRIPDLLTVPGVAGAWTFSFDQPQRHPTISGLNEDFNHRAGSLRMRVLYIDEDPVAVAHDIAEHEVRWLQTDRGLVEDPAEVLFSSAVRTIVPWQDW